MPVVFAQLTQHVGSVTVGQAKIQHEQVELASTRKVERVRAAATGSGRVAPCAQTLLEERGDARLVFGYQDSLHELCMARGITTANVEPIPGSLSTSARPPWASAMAATIDSPSPEPVARGCPAAR